jgi:hypothetical protein
MQDNVKSPSVRVALLIAILTFFIMLIPFALTVKRDHAEYVPDVSGGNISITEKDGIKYVGSGLTVANYTKTVTRGEKASVKVFAENGTVIDIDAYYKSGKSTSAVFNPITVTSGTAYWEWTVPSSSTSDKIRIVLRSESSYATFDIEII